MEALNEQRCPLVKLVLEQALEPELVRVQVLQMQTLVRVRVQPLVQAQPLVQLVLLTQEQSQLELERHLQRNHPKPQLHRHRCKVPDRSRKPQ